MEDYGQGAMSESSRLGKSWTTDELTLLFDMYVNGHLVDSHEHDEISRLLGRYNPNARSHRDRAVNQKLAEIMGQLDRTRARRHPGRKILALVDNCGGDRLGLRAAATAAARSIWQWAEGPVPEYVSGLLGVHKTMSRRRLDARNLGHLLYRKNTKQTCAKARSQYKQVYQASRSVQEGMV
jgi:hypothetical protein